MTSGRIDADTFVSPTDGAAAEYNAMLVGGMAAVGWIFPPESAERLRADLAAAQAPMRYVSASADTMPGPGGVELRVFHAAQPIAVYVHCHSGGWTIGSAADQDATLETIARDLSLTVVSIEYRLAPEHPYPAGLDDCEAATRWVIERAEEQFGASRVLIGGESAGANLALCTLLRVQRTDPGRIAATNLLYGNYDLTGTPSQGLAENPLITKAALNWFTDQYLPDSRAARDDPDVSPLYADLAGLPPVLLSVGAVDSLRDDTVFLAARLLAAGVDIELQVVPGADHGFEAAPYPAAQAAVGRINDFLTRHAKD